MSTNDKGASQNNEPNIPNQSYDVLNPISNDSIIINEDGSNKRRAQLGQWRTPPQPFFPNVTTSSNSQANHIVDTNANGNANINNTNMASSVNHTNLSSNSNIDANLGGENNANMSITDPLHIPSIPPGVDPQDYAALQEAYRRGAEAAAALAHPSHPQHAIAQQALFAAGFAAAQQQQQLKTNLNSQNASTIINTNMQQVSSADNQQQFNSDTKHMYPSLMAATASSLQPTMNQSNSLQQQQQQQQQQLAQVSSIMPSNATVNMNPNIISNTLMNQQQQQKQSSIPMITIPGNTSSIVNSSSIAPSAGTNLNNDVTDIRTINSINGNVNMNANIQKNAAHTNTTQSSNMNSAVGAQAGTGVNNNSRSMSLPDMARFAARATAEEQKRKKRLARNRASARLRRLKKKNLVGAFVTVNMFSFLTISWHRIIQMNCKS